MTQTEDIKQILREIEDMRDINDHCGGPLIFAEIILSIVAIERIFRVGLKQEHTDKILGDLVKHLRDPHDQELRDNHSKFIRHRDCFVHGMFQRIKRRSSQAEGISSIKTSKLHQEPLGQVAPR